MANKKAKTAKKLKPSALRLYYVTAPDLAWAREASKTLLQEGLVACTNILPVMHSFYWWQGRIESASECVLILKSEKSRTRALFKRVTELHPYATPCILSIPLESAEKAYGAWLLEQLK